MTARDAAAAKERSRQKSESWTIRSTAAEHVPLRFEDDSAFTRRANRLKTSAGGLAKALLSCFGVRLHYTRFGDLNQF